MRHLLAVCAIVLLALPAYALPTVHATITTKNNQQVGFTLETAHTQEEREHGLMNRKHLPEHSGMVFFFEKPSIQKFWMKDTFIPLDILFVSDAGEIVFIGHGKPQSLEPIGPDIPITSVIEIAHGTAKKLRVKLGDKVTYDPPHTTHP